MRDMHIKTLPAHDAQWVRPLSRQVDLNLLELFEVVYRTRNLTQAGHYLGLSQPAVSRALGRLRAMYGDALFVRQQRGVAPTPFAEQLLIPVTTALAALRATLAPAQFHPQTESRVFSVAMSDVGERIFLPRLMQFLSRAAPGVVIRAISPTMERLDERLAEGQLDLAVGFLGAMSKQVRQQRLFHERFVYVVRRGHPAIGGELRQEQLAQVPHVVGGPEGMEHASAVERVLGSPQVRAPIALRVHSLLCVGPVVAESNLIGLIPSNLANSVASHLPLQLLGPPVPFPGFEIAMAWHDRLHGDPANRWLREVFNTLFATPG